MKFCELSHCPPETCVSIGDRYDIDLDIPLKLGMGAILVDGVEDVCELPGVLGEETILKFSRRDAEIAKDAEEE